MSDRLPVSSLPLDDERRPDSMTVRLALVESVNRGEITLEEAQRRIRALTRRGVADL